MEYKQIDITFFESFYEGNDEFKGKMISMFMEKAPVFMREIGEHLDQENWIDLGASAHKFKSCIDFVGAKGLREAASEIEQNAKGTKVEGMSMLVSNMNDLCNEVMSELENELAIIKTL